MGVVNSDLVLYKLDQQAAWLSWVKPNSEKCSGRMAALLLPGTRLLVRFRGGASHLTLPS